MEGKFNIYREYILNILLLLFLLIGYSDIALFLGGIGLVMFGAVRFCGAV